MKSSGQYMIEGKAEVDETVVGGQETGVVGRKNNKKKLVVFTIEQKGKGVGRVYGEVIKKSSAKESGSFMKATISPNIEIKTYNWTGYNPLKEAFPNLNHVNLGKKGENFPDLHQVIMGFKAWLRGMHHSVKHLQSYIDEYCYRINRQYMTDGIFDNLMRRMVAADPCPCKAIIS